jgi:hypothetical protein
VHVDLLCLANSRKYQANCIAGKEWSSPDHSWIRPVSNTEHGEVSSDVSTPQGLWPSREVRPLDIVRVELQGTPFPQVHPEDRLLGPTPWEHKGTIHPSQLGAFADPPDTPIPLDPNSSSTDHLSSAFVRANPLRRSLWLIEVPSLKLASKSDGDRVKWYVEFAFGGVDYRLRVTDEYFRARLEKQGRLHDGPRPEKHLCISIGVYFAAMDAYYKLAAAVLP